MTSALKFRKIYTGTYGTGIHREPIGSIGLEWPGMIELVIDHMNDGWWIREMTVNGDFTDRCGEAFYTLREAKAYMIRIHTFA
jgi:hypothetical protein